VQDLDVSGLTASPIHRDLARVEGTAFGPRSGNGLPAGWQEAKADLKSGEVNVDLTATHQDDGIAVLAAAGLEVASPVPGRAEAKAAFVVKGRALEIDELSAGITPGPARPGHG
jgi:hypothetical protein